MLDPTPDLVRGLGITLALLGAFLSAPAGTVLGVRVLGRGARQLRDQLARTLLRRQPPPPRVVTGSARGTFGFTGSARGRVGYPSAGVDERLAWLHEQLLELEQRVADSEQALRVEQQERRSTVAELDTRVRGRLGALDAQLRDERQRAATWQARGLPVIAASVVLTAGPLAVVAPGLLAQRRRQAAA